MHLSKKIVILSVFFLILCSINRAEFQEVNIDNVSAELLSKEKMRFCYISFVRINGHKYLIKQKHVLRKILGCVRDALTAHIAESFDIAHKVKIIPANKNFPGKIIPKWPATIHTIAPGKMIKAQNSQYNRMDIKQAEIGFRREMLHWMAKHPVLIIVVALDTFLCNHDRHRGNLFYDARHDSFCAIDMDSALKYNLCALACKFFSAMLNRKNNNLSHKEIKVLQKYKEYLEFLIAHNPAQETIALYNSFVEKAGFIPGSSLYTKKLELELDRNRRMIRESYKDAQRLVQILEKVVKRAKKSARRMRY